MREEENKIKKRMQEHSEKLMNLGSILAKNQFSYKIEEKTSKEFWQNRIKNFEKYNELSLSYYNQIQKMMNIINEEQAKIFLLQISKFHQLGTELIKMMQQVEKTPSIISSKDKQQSQWSKKIKESLGILFTDRKSVV